MSGSPPTDRQLGPLERRLLETLWSRVGEASVRDVASDFPHLAYTTLMTTLDRLHKKGLLARRRRGRAYVYVPRLSRTEFDRHHVERAMGALLDTAEGPALAHTLSFFVEKVSSRDRTLLDRLDQLVRERRRAAKGER
jgi:predicted transcriptional regulator